MRKLKRILIAYAALFGAVSAWGVDVVVTFNQQSGSGGEVSRSVSVGDKTLGGRATSKPSRSGYQFCGYFTGTGGTGTQVFDSNGAVIGMWQPQTATTVYASWIQVQGFSSLPGYGTSLSAGAFYSVTSSTTRNGGDFGGGISGLDVYQNGVSYLYIPSGVTLTCNGGDGSGTQSGGAGVYLVYSSTLVVFGGGTLIATGGKAGNGANGGATATAASITQDTEYTYSHYRDILLSQGGTGGAGGGGGGAGIGGCGGYGGAAVSAPGESTSGRSHKKCTVVNAGFNWNGKDGTAGNAGKDGVSMSTLYVMGNVSVRAQGGVAGSGGSVGLRDVNKTAHYAYTYDGKKFSLNIGAGGGGGGGGGGWAGYGIGSGGGGGGSGSSGANSGSFVVNESASTWYCHGACGAGGAGAVSGASGGLQYTLTGAWNFNDGKGNINVSGGQQASGGSRGYYGDLGKTYKAPTASIWASSGGAYTSVSSLPALQRTLTLDACGGTGGTASQTVDFQCGFNWKGANVTVPTRDGYVFEGYYTDQFGRGTKLIDWGGRWVNSYGTFASRRLYANWIVGFKVSVPAVQHTTYSVTVDGKTSAVYDGQVIEPVGSTVAVTYKADTGYYLPDETTVTLVVTDEYKELDVSKVTVRSGYPCTTWAEIKTRLDAGSNAWLVQDVVADSQIHVDKGQTVTVDLGGHKLAAGKEDQRLFRLSDGSLTIQGGMVDGNGYTYPWCGQLAYVVSTNNATATLTVSGVTVQNMRSADCGGAICVSNGVLTVTNATIRACSSESYGGGICNFNGRLKLDDCAVEDCTSAKGGGGVYNQNKK